MVVTFIPIAINGATAIMHKARFHPLINANVNPDTNNDMLKISWPNRSPNAF